MILGFAGAARAGKDTCGGQVIPNTQSAIRIAFADRLKKEVCDALGITLDELTHKKEILRPLLVEWGRARRTLQQDYWIEMLRQSYEDGPTQFKHLVITDVRYRNEGEWITKQGGIVAYVSRPGYPPCNAEERQSLRELRDFMMHEAPQNQIRWIENSTKIEDLFKFTGPLIETLKKGIL